MKPDPIGSETVTNTIWNRAALLLESFGNRSGMRENHVGLQADQFFREQPNNVQGCASAKRASMRTLRPSDHPRRSSPRLNDASRDFISGSSSADPISMPMRCIRSGCCARAASGHAAAPPSKVMNSRRLDVGHGAFPRQPVCRALSLPAYVVCLSPDSGHSADIPGRQLRATSELMRCSTQQLHSITSSARPSKKGGTVSPRVLAVLRLITSSNLTGCSIGKSAGFAPFKTFCT